MAKGQGADRKRQLSQLAAEAEATAGAKFRPVAGRSPFSPIQCLAQRDVPMAPGAVTTSEGHRRLEAQTSGDSSESAGNDSFEASSGSHLETLGAAAFAYQSGIYSAA